MAVKVRIPTPLRWITKGEDEVAVYSESLSEILGLLDKKYPGIKERLFSEDGSVRRFINIYLNDEDIRFLDNTVQTNELKNFNRPISEFDQFHTYLEDHDVRISLFSDTKVKDGDIITIVPAIAGGA